MKIKRIKKKKHLIRALKVYAKENCKPVNYYALEKFERPMFDEEEGWKTGIVVQHPVNHGRRVKKAFLKYGLKGAMGYLTVFKKEKPLEVGVGEASIV